VYNEASLQVNWPRVGMSANRPCKRSPVF